MPVKKTKITPKMKVQRSGKQTPKMSLHKSTHGTQHQSGPKMVSFGRAVSNFFKKYFRFNGVATRAEYWWVTLFVLAVWAGLLETSFLLYPKYLLAAGILAFFWLLFGVITFIPLWTIQSRRLHDAGFSAKILWISFAFFLYNAIASHYMIKFVAVDWLGLVWGIFVLVLFLMPSKLENNPYRD